MARELGVRRDRDRAPGARADVGALVRPARGPLLLLLPLLAGCLSAPIAPQPTGLHVEVIGEGPPMVLLHGFGGTLYSWRHLRDSLAGDYRLILVDLKGHGRSPKPADSDYSTLEQARLVHELLVELDLRDVTLVGNSYGGGVALFTMLRLIELGDERVTRLVLIDGAAYPQRHPWHLALLRTPVLGALSLALVSPRAAVRMVLDKTFEDDDRIPEDAIEAYAAPLREPGGKRALLELARQVEPPDFERRTAEYAGIAAPTLIVWGKEDEIVPLWVGRRLQKELPDARLRIIPACGHAPQEECWELLLPLIRAFLEDRRAPSGTNR